MKVCSLSNLVPQYNMKNICVLFLFFFSVGIIGQIKTSYAAVDAEMAAISNKSTASLLKQFRHISMLTSKPIMIKSGRLLLDPPI
jgi:ABC-type sulfate transport system permease component